MRRTMIFVFGIFALCVFFIYPIYVKGQNITITESNLMAQVGKVPDSVIITAIGMASKVDIKDSQSLKGRGVSQAVVDALLKKQAELLFAETAAAAEKVTPVANQNATPAGGMIPEDVGAYVLMDGSLTPLPIEVSRTKGGGMMKSMATMGVKRMKASGLLDGGQSSMRLKSPITLILKCLPGTDYTEYSLLDLKESKNQREFTTGKIGFMTRVGLDNKEKVGVTFEKVGKNCFRAALTLENGEYGIIQTSTVGLGTQNKLYTFGVSVN